MPLFRKGAEPHALAVAMSGVRMGDRLLQVGCADRTLLGALASRVGLSGRACAIVYREDEAARAAASAARAGALVEVESAKNGSFPFEDEVFDLVVIDSTGGLLASGRPEDRVKCLQESRRVVRPGGRIVVIETAVRGGLGALFSRRPTDPHYAAAGGVIRALEAEGFRSPRTLAEREGLRFIEAMKQRT